MRKGDNIKITYNQRELHLVESGWKYNHTTGRWINLYICPTGHGEQNLP